MIGNVLKQILIFFFWVGSVVGCSKRDAKEPVEEPFLEESSTEKVYLKDSLMLIGKWHLVKVTTSGFSPDGKGPVSYDYSQNDIVYEFKTNGVLTISSETDNIGNYCGDRLRDYQFLFSHDNLRNCYIIEISHFPHWYLISAEELVLDTRPLDGDMYKLEKIE